MVQFATWEGEITCNYYVPSESITAEGHSWQILLVYYNIILSGEWKFEFRRNMRLFLKSSDFDGNLTFEVSLYGDHDPEKSAMKYSASDLRQY